MAGTGKGENQEAAASGQETAQDQVADASTGAGEEQEELVRVPKGAYEKMQNDLKSMVGRMKGVGALEGELRQAKDAMQQNRDAQAHLQAQLDALEDERMNGKAPDVQALLKEKRQLSARLRTLEGENTTLKAGTSKLAELEKTQRGMQIAAEVGVKLEVLAEFLDLPEEKLRALATRLKGAGEPEVDEKGKLKVKGQTGDSLSGRGAPAMSDKDFLTKYSAGDLPDTPAIHKKAAALLQSQGINVGRS